MQLKIYRCRLVWTLGKTCSVLCENVIFITSNENYDVDDDVTKHRDVMSAYYAQTEQFWEQAPPSVLGCVILCCSATYTVNGFAAGHLHSLRLL